MQSESTTNALTEREEKINNLKKRMVAVYGSSLLKIKEGKTLEALRSTDTPEERARKIEANRQIVAEREEMYKLHENDMLSELDKIVKRIETAPKPPRPEGIYALTDAAPVTTAAFCTECRNKDPNYFFSDPLSGDVICEGVEGSGCGAVILDQKIFTGAEKRNFENEEDRNHFGPAPNKLMPDVVNMETSMMTTVNGKESAAFKRLAQAQRNIELNLDTIGRDDRHTRLGYKIKMKRKAFGLLEEIGAILNLHQAVVNRAKERFSEYRDVRDAVHDFDASILACLVLAYEELSWTQQVDLQPLRTGVVSVDIGAPAKARSLPPRESVVDDVAISAVPQLGMGSFSIGEVTAWLREVAQAASSVVDGQLVADHIAQAVTVLMSKEKEGSRESSRPESSLSSFTSIAQRSNRLNSTATDGAGRQLLRVNVAAEVQRMVESTKGVSSERDRDLQSLGQYFKEAILRRSQYDKTIAEQDRLLAQERKRLRTEVHSSVPQKLRMMEEFQKKQDSMDMSSSTGASQAPAEEELQVLDVDLEDLIGGSITVISSSTPTPAPAPSTIPKKPSTTPADLAVPVPIAVKYEAVAVKSEPHSLSQGSNGSNSNAAAIADKKKVGARPRPKIVLS